MALPTASTVVRMPKRLRVMLVASGGGHWIELSRLAPAFRDCDCEFVSTAPNLSAPTGDRPVHMVTDSSRTTLANTLRSVVEMWKLIRDVNPDLVVSTGAAPGAVALIIARLRGIRTIWIDSIAASDELSLSGRMVRYAADLRLTQWPHLVHSNRHLQYFGRIL